MRAPRLLFWLLLAWGAVRPAALAAAPSHLQPFQRLVILDQGRKKPMDTFARTLLKRISGRSALAGMDAAGWLARVFFCPWETHDDRVFLVNDPDVLAAVGLPAHGRGRYSFRQLHPRLDRLRELAYQASSQQGEPGRVEGGIIRLYFNVSAYYQMAGAFHYVWSGTPGGESGQKRAAAPAIVPLGAGDAEEWLSPAAAQARAGRMPAAVQRELSLLSGAARAYTDRRWPDFAAALAAFNQSLRERLPSRDFPGGRIALEIAYNRLDPFFLAQLAYGLALLLFLASAVAWRRWLRRLTWLFLLVGLSAHTGGVIVRMLITGRPPVTNLYETFIFVGWAGVMMGIVLERFQKHGLGILCSGFLGPVFLLIAGRFGLDGDTMGMLAAVLDSNLWLSVHVVTIAVGYAGCMVAGVIGHWILIQALLARQGTAARSRPDQALLAALSFGLAFTGIGTIMGGVWADQSWGRFWGWDPKENGALLIILWCAILLHSRRAGWLGRIGLAAGAVGAIVAVALTWFGINLLGVGMHAYGFTSGVGRGLILFIMGELAFIAVSLGRIRRKGRRGGAGSDAIAGTGAATP